MAAFGVTQRSTMDTKKKKVGQVLKFFCNNLLFRESNVHYEQARPTGHPGGPAACSWKVRELSEEQAKLPFLLVSFVIPKDCRDFVV